MTSTTYEMDIARWVPWAQLNEYEGQLEGTVQGHPLCCYILIPSGEWERSNEVRLSVRLWIERSGAVQVLADATPALEQLDGVYYRVVGRVYSLQGEYLTLESIFPLEVDLDICYGGESKIPPMREGSWISVIGRLQVELMD